MSNPNPNPSSTNNNGGTPDNQRPPFAAFNLKGWTPRMCTFHLTVDEFCNAVLEIARTYVPDFKSCNYEPGANGHKALLLWIAADSPHLVDKSSMQGTVLRRAVRHQSPQLKEFINKFCRASDRDGSPEIRDPHFKYGEILALDQYAENEKAITAIVANPKPFIDAMFDSSGQGYQAKYGVRAPSTFIECRYVYKNKEKRSGLTGIEIVKRTRDQFNRVPHTKFGVQDI